MSAEKINSTEINSFSPLETHKKSEEFSSSGRVDINILINRARKIKQKENQTNIIFFCLFASIILIVGIILSF